jgi:hypothetical protein
VAQKSIAEIVVSTMNLDADEMPSMTADNLIIMAISIQAAADANAKADADAREEYWLYWLNWFNEDAKAQAKADADSQA